MWRATGRDSIDSRISPLASYSIVVTYAWLWLLSKTCSYLSYRNQSPEGKESLRECPKCSLDLSLRGEMWTWLPRLDEAVPQVQQFNFSLSIITKFCLLRAEITVRCGFIVKCCGKFHITDQGHSRLTIYSYTHSDTAVMMKSTRVLLVAALVMIVGETQVQSNLSKFASFNS